MGHFEQSPCQTSNCVLHLNIILSIVSTSSIMSMNFCFGQGFIISHPQHSKHILSWIFPVELIQDTLIRYLFPQCAPQYPTFDCRCSKVALQPQLLRVDCLELVTHLCWTTFIAMLHGPDTPKEAHGDLFHLFYQEMSLQTAVEQGGKAFFFPM